MAKRQQTADGRRQQKSAVSKLGYEAVKNSPRRGSAATSTKSEDHELTVAGRQMLSSLGRDLVRNNALVTWAVRRNNQTVAKCDFKCAIPGQAEYNALVKQWVHQWGHRLNCDIARRHSLPELINLMEAHRVIDGDVGILKCNNGKIQIIEGDRIRNPAVPHVVSSAQNPDYEWIHGVKVGYTGQAFKYAIHRRKEGVGFEFEREVSAEHMILCGYFTRHDQVRGVSLLAPAINQFRDIFESIDYALAKAKVSQLLGFSTALDFAAREHEEEDASEAITKSIQETYGTGALHFNLGVNEKAEMIESKTPSTEFQDFLHNVIRIAFAALDIPLEFLMPNIANFYSNKGALASYIESCRLRQAGLLEALNEITDWRLAMAIANGELPPPPNGMDIEEMLWWCDWEGARMPLWKLQDDAKGALVAIQTGLLSGQKIGRQYGLDSDETYIEIAQELTRAKELGINLAYAAPITSNNMGN